MVAKQVADFLTALRGLIALVFVWVGYTSGEAGLQLIAWLLLLAWVTDWLDGELARRSSRQYRTWLGEHDLQIDIAVACGLLLYLLEAQVITPLTAVLYTLFWAVILVRWGFNRSFGMLLQAPIYGRFLWAVLRVFPQIGLWLATWLIGLIIITWPRFPQHVIPDFLHGIQAVWSPKKPKNDLHNHTSKKVS